MDSFRDRRDQDPPDRFDLILRPESPTNPIGLEEEIAAIIRQKVASLVQQPSPAEWTEPDLADRSPKAVAVEARVFHTIDEISTENARRVEERDRPRPGVVVGLRSRLLAWCLRLFRRDRRPAPAAPAIPDVDAARRRIEAAVEQCHRDGITPGAQVTTATTTAHQTRE